MREENPLKVALAQLNSTITLANVLETPKAAEYRKTQRQVEALKIRSEKKEPSCISMGKKIKPLHGYA